LTSGTVQVALHVDPRISRARLKIWVRWL
jgi:hypothetical protein